MKELHNQFLQVTERNRRAPQGQKYETGSLLSSLCSMNLAPIGFGTAFFSLPRF